VYDVRLSDATLYDGMTLKIHFYHSLCHTEPHNGTSFYKLITSRLFQLVRCLGCNAEILSMKTMQKQKQHRKKSSTSTRGGQLRKMEFILYTLRLSESYYHIIITSYYDFISERYSHTNLSFSLPHFCRWKTFES